MNAHAPVLKWLVSLRAPAREADWEALYRQELLRIYNFFRYRTGDDVLAEDLTPMTFEKAWRALQQHRPDWQPFPRGSCHCQECGRRPFSEDRAWSCQSMS